MKVHKTSIVIMPKNEDELHHLRRGLEAILGETQLEYEILAIAQGNIEPDFCFDYQQGDNYKLILIGQELNKFRALNVIRQYASDESKYLLFVDSLDGLTPDVLRYRIELFAADPSVGVTGEFDASVAFDPTKFFYHLATEVNLTQEEYKNKCFGTEGEPLAVKDTIWATQLSTWDKIGGMPLKSPSSFLEYQFRCLLLGYKIITR